ncbi:MAG: hypothetical protein QOE58_650 [Actinomycetota bacterium]|nr:hypothetical protein [Actinomycetota bacterium]
MVIATLLVSAGCTSTPHPASNGGSGPNANGRTLTWSKVILPRGIEPVTLAASGTQLLVGGSTASGRVKPRLLRIAPNGSYGEVPLIPHGAYAFEARWRSIVSDGRRVIAVGGAPGGAHSNTRWTTWTGTSAGMTESAQPFDTFGGWGAGDLIGPVMTGSKQREPAIVGSWQGAKSGLDAAIWLPRGDRWVRQPSAGSALESTRDLLVGPRSVTSAGAGILLSGSALHLVGGLARQSAAVWRSTSVNQGWTRVDLPSSGRTSEAVSADCHGQNCVVAGYVDGAVALWRLSGSVAVRILSVPHAASSPRSSILAPMAAGGLIIDVVSAGRNGLLLIGGDRSWARFQGPAGEPVSSALVGGWVYVIGRSATGLATLWRCPVKALTDHRG